MTKFRLILIFLFVTLFLQIGVLANPFSALFRAGSSIRAMNSARYSKNIIHANEILSIQPHRAYAGAKATNFSEARFYGIEEAILFDASATSVYSELSLDAKKSLSTASKGYYFNPNHIEQFKVNNTSLSEINFSQRVPKGTVEVQLNSGVERPVEMKITRTNQDNLIQSSEILILGCSMAIGLLVVYLSKVDTQTSKDKYSKKKDKNQCNDFPRTNHTTIIEIPMRQPNFLAPVSKQLALPSISQNSKFA